MKKILRSALCLVFICFALQGKAAPVEINIEEPGINEAAYQENADATEIVLKGKINQYDLLWLAQYCKSVEDLDMSQVSIMDYYDEISYTEYQADHLTNALSSAPNLKNIILPESLKSIENNALRKCPMLESITVPCPSVPKTGKYIIETNKMSSVKLFVPEDLVETYKNSNASAWKFDNILPIKAEGKNPYDGLVLDDFYGQCYYPLSDNLEYDPIFYVFYMTNNSETTANVIEFAYWFDGDKSDIKYKTKKDIQLLPGQEMGDGLGFITFDSPEDTEIHTITIRPVKVDGVEVDLGERVKVFRRYTIDNTYRKPTHLVEIFADPNNADNYEKYQTMITAMSKLENGTQQPGRYEVVSYVSNPGEVFKSDDPSVNDLAMIYGISEMPRVMLNRSLMTPYGMLQNDWALLNLKNYTPGMKIGELTDVYEYLLQRSFYNPAFAEMNPSMEKTEDGKFIFNVSGKISVEQNTNDLFLNVYLVENTPLPELDESDMYPNENNPVFHKFIKAISPFGGYELKVNEDRTYSFATEAFDVEGYEEGKYRIVASIYNYNDLFYKMAILQSCGIAVEEPEELSMITATTIQEGGEMSFAVAAAKEGTKVSIDWGDGVFTDYTVGTDYDEFKSELKGKNLRIQGNITKLNCIANKLTQLDVTMAPQLEILQAEYNYLEELNLSNSVNLINLEIFSNMFKAIDLTNCVKLQRFVASDNYIENVDMSKCTALEYFDCSRTGRLEMVDFSECHNIKNIVVNECSITDMIIPEDAPIEEILCSKNKLTDLEIGSFKNLRDLDCSGNAISELNVASDKLQTFYAMDNMLEGIDLSVATDLRHLKLANNTKLYSVDLSNNTKLETVGISNCGIEKIDVTMLPELSSLWSVDNKLETIDLSNNTKLRLLKLANNSLKYVTFPTQPDSLSIVSMPENELSSIEFMTTMEKLISLDLGSNALSELITDNLPALEVLNLKGNYIHELSFKNNPNLNTLGIVGNDMTSEELNNVYRELPELQEEPTSVNLYNGTKKDKAAAESNTDIAVAKNWKPFIIGDGSGYDNIENVETSGLTINSHDGTVEVTSPFSKSVIRIYTTDGKLMGEYKFEGSYYSFTSNLKGVYVFRCADRSNGREISSKKVL